MMTSDRTITPPMSPYVLGLILTSPILTREMHVVYAIDGLMYRQFARGGVDEVKWHAYSHRDYPHADEYEAAMSQFFARLDSAGWQVSPAFPPFIFDAEPDWLKDLSRKRAHPKMTDAFRTYIAAREARVDIESEVV